MSAQVWLNMNLVCLQKAVLCANCEVISGALNGLVLPVEVRPCSV
jgi:hypothetical protein